VSEQSDLTNALLREKGILPPDDPSRQAEAIPPEESTPELPKIRHVGRNVGVNQFARQLGAVMCTNGVFLRGDVPVVLDKKRARLKELTARAFRSYAENHAYLYKPEKSGEEWIEVKYPMPKDVAGDVLGSFDFLDQQRHAWRVNPVPAPILRADGRIELLKEGFDYESEILTMPAHPPFEYRLMPVEEVRTFFVNLTKDFSFAERNPSSGLSRSLAVHIAAMLTPFVMGLMPRKALIPMFIYTANMQGSGKSLLSKMALYASFGSASALPFGKDEEELRKLLDTEALANSPFIFFDNVKRTLSSALLDQWLTQTSWKGRRMGGQVAFEVDKQGVVYISSNHAETDKDSTRRALFCELFLEDADISGRKFDLLIDDDYLIRHDVRTDMLSALWSMVVHWDRQKRPKGPTQLGSFERWSEIVGGIVVAAGFGDPLERAETIVAGDTDTKDLKTLVGILAARLTEKVAEERRAAEAAAEEALEVGKPVPAALSEEELKSMEFEFDEIIDLCRAHDLFVKRIDGKLKVDKDSKEETFELTRSSRIQLGKLFQKESGKKWIIPSAGKVRFGRRGSKNWRSFFVDLVEE